jgi:O-antigen/teichoic acid export membrane protein
MSLSTVFKQSSIYLAGDIARRTVGLLTLPIYTRFLTPADYGTIELIELFLAVAAIVFGILATSEAMIRIHQERVRQKQQEEESAARLVVSTALWQLVAGSLVLVGLAYVFAEPFSRLILHDSGQAYLVRWAFVAMLFSNVGELCLVYERLQQRPYFFVGYSVSQLLATVGLNILFIAFMGMGVWGFVLSKLITSGVGALLLFARVTREVGMRFDRRAGLDMLYFGYPLIASSLALFGIHFGDRFFVGQYGTLADVGLYALAYKFGFLVTNLVGEPFGRSWGVNLYAYAGRPDWKEYFSRVFSYLAFLLILAATAISLFVDNLLVIIATPAFFSCAVMVPWIALAYGFREMGDFFRGILFVEKRAKLYSQITVVCTVLNLALNFALISSWGALGAALATLFTWLAYFIISWVVVQKKHRLAISLPALSLLIGAAVMTYIASQLTRGIPYWATWAADAGLLALFALAVWAGGYFPSSERARIKQYLISSRRSAAVVLPRFQ